jgi:hypothetical protein
MRDEELLQPEIGLDARHNTAPLLGERGEIFFLDIPSDRTHRTRGSHVLLGLSHKQIKS